ncbi:YadA family autotransporter adhesin [Paraburkholderia hospita]|uniref:YadA family autotransporter adhesin n=1 Tax=Paraburkholderia hospita TaxID=169430 RepID=UPI000DEFAC13|nr:ESPR-type extended signal peptide-containing protein [Paraburkholderia hospita]AXE97883.1 adhesin [Paraburkholderia hospita]
MNKTYRNVWCAKTGTFIAAAETARAKGKSARSGMRALTCATLLTLGGVAGAAHAGALDGGSTLGGIATDIAYGSGAQTTNAAGGKAAVAIGQNASANNLSGATPNVDGTVAVGDSAKATDGGVAVGGASYAGSMSTAVGAGATAATANSVALGANSVANSTTLGTAGFAPVGGTAISAAMAAGEVSIGKAGAERRITNVAAGLNPTDAVNLSQLMSVDAKVNNITNGGGIKYFRSNSTAADSQTFSPDGIAIGGGAVAGQSAAGYSYIAPGAVAIGSNALSAARNSIAIGTNASVTNGLTANGNNLIAMGANATASYGHSIAIGGNASAAPSSNGSDGFGYATALGDGASANAAGATAVGANAVGSGSNATAIGAGASATGNNSSAFGINANAAGTYGLAMGYGSNASNAQSTAVGFAATASGVIGTALGFSANAAGDRSVALGSQASVAAGTNLSMALGRQSSATANNAVALGAGSVANLDNTISVGSAGAERQIVNVAKGVQGTDAVNVSQLTPVVNALGGGAAIDPVTGVVTNPTYVVGGSTINNVGGAISNIDARTTQNSSDITNLTTAINNGELGLVRQDATTRNITVAKTTDGTIVDFTGTAGARKLTGVLAGDVSASSADAVNGSQLYSLANSTASAIGGGSTVNSDGSISAPSYVIGGTTMNSIAGAITNIDARTTQNSNDITTIDARTTQIAGDVTNLDARTTQMSSDITNLTTAINSGELGLVQQDDTTRNITVAKATDGTIVDFTGTAGARKLTGVLAGNVNASSVDAVNGSQLYSVANSTASAIGGGSTVNSDGSISAPSYVIGGKTVNSIGGAVTNIDARTTQLANDVTNLTTSINNGEYGLVQQDATTRNITVAKTTDGTIVDFTGTAGARKLTGVLAGDVSASSADAVNGSQLYSLANSTASAIGGGSTVNSDGSISAPSYVIGGTTMNSIAGAITNIDARTTQNASDISSINTALSDITGGGMGIKYFHTNSMLADSQATGSESVAIGGAAVATASNSVALGSNSVANRANSVSVGSVGAERQITNVAAGTADTDAVNVAQLKATGLVGTDGTSKAAVTYDSNADGSVSYSSVTMGNGVAGGTTIHNVAAGTVDTDAVNVGQMNSALANVTNIAMNSSAGNPMFAASGDRSAEAASANGQHATAMGANAKASADNSVALGANSVADRANTVSVGSKGNERQIANVAAGTQGTDAVNVDQMNDAVASATGNLPAGMSAKDYTDQRFNSMQNTVNQVAKNSYAGVAAAMAMPNMTPSQPGNTVVAAGAGSYKSGAALGVGATYRSRNSKWLVNGAVSVTSTGDAGVRAQVGYEF